MNIEERQLLALNKALDLIFGPIIPPRHANPGKPEQNGPNEAEWSEVDRYFLNLCGIKDGEK